MIYFIENPDKSRIKIGTTIRLSTRLKQLVTEYGEGLRVVAVTDGDRDREQELHRRFAHLRDVGEWFEPGDDLRAFIVSDGQEWQGEDEAPRKAVLHLKGTEAQAEWLEAVHRKTHLSKTVIVRLALSLWAEKNGHQAFPMSEGEDD